MKTGLVVEGGAMRGLYAAGVLDVFLEKNIHADGVIGVSAGAVHGCSYVSKQLGRSIRYYCKYSKHKEFMSWYSFFTTGEIVGRKFCYDELPNKLDPFDNEAFMASEQDFYAVATDCNTGKPKYFLCKDLKKEIDKIRASASMPLVSKMVDIEGGQYLDGGIADSIPVKKAMELGYDKVIVVLTRVAGYRKKSEQAVLMRLLYGKYPKLVEAMANRADNYNSTIDYIEKLEAKGKIIVVRPSVDLHISRMEKNPDKLRKLYNLGRKDTEKLLGKIKEYINN